jgi:thiol-disulfide isomerase/thioredoxin
MLIALEKCTMKKFSLIIKVLTVVSGLSLFVCSGCKKQDTTGNTPPPPVKQTETSASATPTAQTVAQTATTEPLPAKTETQPEQPAALPKPAPNENTIAEGYAFPNLSFTSLKGDQVNLADYKGKVVLIDFWATWCGPCIRAMPGLIETYKEYHEKGFEIIGISLDRDKSQLESYLKTNSITWQQYYDGLYWNNKLARRFSINAIPHAVIVDKSGQVYFNTNFDKNKMPLEGAELKKVIAKLCSSSV